MTDAEVIKALIEKLGSGDETAGRKRVAAELDVTRQALEQHVKRDRIGAHLRYKVWALAHRYAILLPVDWIGKEAA